MVSIFSLGVTRRVSRFVVVHSWIPVRRERLARAESTWIWMALIRQSSIEFVRFYTGILSVRRWFPETFVRWIPIPCKPDNQIQKISYPKNKWTLPSLHSWFGQGTLVFMFFFLHLRGRSCHGDEIMVRLDLPHPITYSDEILQAGKASAHCNHAGCNRNFIIVWESLNSKRLISECFFMGTMRFSLSVPLVTWWDAGVSP